jgi:hypothetical protein
MSSTAACGADNVCLADKIVSKAWIDFDFGVKQFSSSQGEGVIGQTWDRPDGTHMVTVSSPPASATLTFSADWSHAGLLFGGSVHGYDCERVQSR